MKICYLDAFSGIGGDMVVGALADAGADTSTIAQSLSKLKTGAEFRFEKTTRHGIGATKFHVTGGEPKKHRHLSQIIKMIEDADIAERVKRDATAVFRRLGEAEAAVHRVAVEKVHLHEVGAVDSIADVVGTCLGLALLGVEEIQCSAVNTGSGTVKTEHGLLPVPAPATAVLLAGKPIYARGPESELTTPTGAAVAVTLASRFGALPAMRLTGVGYGAGGREFPDHASVLRVMLGEANAATEAVIEANIDDLTPQVLGNAVGRLLESGALDFTFTPIFLKNKRPGTLLRVVTRPEDRERLAQIVLASFGPSACALSLTSAAFRPAG